MGMAALEPSNESKVSSRAQVRVTSDGESGETREAARDRRARAATRERSRSAEAATRAGVAGETEEVHCIRSAGVDMQ